MPNERPHESSGRNARRRFYRSSPRPYPESLPSIEYAGHLETRKVGHNGMIRWKNDVLFSDERSVVERRTTVTRCNLCARSGLSPMFPAAR